MSQRRLPAGLHTGGQFASSERAEADSVLLVDTAPAEQPVDSDDPGRRQALCPDCFQAIHDHDPDMSDADWLGFEPGSCTRCGNARGTVFWVSV